MDTYVATIKFDIYPTIDLASYFTDDFVRPLEADFDTHVPVTVDVRVIAPDLDEAKRLIRTSVVRGGTVRIMTIVKHDGPGDESTPGV
jgi:hypothetical protein